MLILANCKVTQGNYGENYTKEFFLVHDFQVSLIKIQLRYTESWKNHDGGKIREVKEEEYKIEIVLC